MPKRVAFILSRITQGGTERACLNTAIACAEAGMDTHIVLREANREVSYEVPESITIHLLGGGLGTEIKDKLRRIRSLREVLDEIEPDWVVSFNHGYLNMLLSGTFFRFHTVTSERFYPKAHYKGRPVSRCISSLAYTLSSKIVFQTPENKHYYGKRIQSKSVVIPNAIAPDLPKYVWDESHRAVVTACRLEPQKNPELLIRSFGLFRDSGHESYVLRIFGSGSLEDKLWDLVAKLGLKDSVEIMPFRANVHQAMLDAAMFVSSSDFEGIQNSLLEAMGMGIPCVATDCLGGGAKLLIGEHNERGLLVPRGDVQALAAAMEQLACDKILSQQYSTAGHELADKYSVDAISARWVELLQ